MMGRDVSHSPATCGGKYISILQMYTYIKINNTYIYIFISIYTCMMGRDESHSPAA